MNICVIIGPTGLEVALFGILMTIGDLGSGIFYDDSLIEDSIQYCNLPLILGLVLLGVGWFLA